MQNHEPDFGAYLPTPEQIEQDTAAIRAGWDAFTEYQRRVTRNTCGKEGGPAPYEVEEYRLDTGQPGRQSRGFERVG